MSSVRRPRVLVGVSGSTASLIALQWAAEEARHRQARLEVVLVWQPPSTAPYAVQAPHSDHRQMQDAAGRALAASINSLGQANLPGGLTADVVEGMPERVLAERSVDAAMLVLGSTSSPVQAGRSIGPVIRGCLSRAGCPVVVIGPANNAREPAAWPEPRRSARPDDLGSGRAGGPTRRGPAAGHLDHAPRTSPQPAGTGRVLVPSPRSCT
jgi:nucleotide-binding universal stress UspA family protein